MFSILTDLTQKTVAILGATSHIAKNIIFELSVNSQYKFLLYSRSSDPVKSFLTEVGLANNSNINCYLLSDFGDVQYDVVINCIGIGNPGKLQEDYHQIFYVTEYYDNLILDYLKNKSSQTLYVNLSSGAAYGTDFRLPADYDSTANLKINNLYQQDYYGIAKLNAEAKHRSLEKYNIVDLRVFSFFSRFIDLNTRFLITEMVKCIKDNITFITNSNDILRDYVSPKDFCNLIHLCIHKSFMNVVYDVYSSAPVSKFELIKAFKDEFSMNYLIDDKTISSNSTGPKSIYYSENKRAEEIQYYPSSTSLDAIMKEVKKIMNNNR
jgi:nucleoside-diphosphate-sugar epimerase